MTTSKATGNSPPVTTTGHRPRLTTRLAIVLLVVVYLALALTFTLLTRAYEGDDEAAHTGYVEYVVQHHSIPHISVANGGESHQPPLYYLLEAGWQEVLGIPAFVPHVSLVKGPIGPNQLVLSHDYDAAQHRAAVHLHELRLLSVLFGLGTVLLTYAGARVVGMRQVLALGCGLVVALLPRELVLSTDLTNDALIIPLCALGLVLFLLAERARSEGRFGYRRLHLLTMGHAVGAGAITKFSGLPVAGILLALAFVPSVTVKRRDVGVPVPTPLTSPSDSTRSLRLAPRFLVDGIIAVVAFLAVSGWWFIRNRILYGQFLASRRSEGYLKAFLGRCPSGRLEFTPALPSSASGVLPVQLVWTAQSVLADLGERRPGCCRSLVSGRRGLGPRIPSVTSVADRAPTVCGCAARVHPGWIDCCDHQYQDHVDW